MLNLVELFDNLKPPPSTATEGGVRFSVSSIPSYERHRIGVDGQGNPVLLIGVAQAPENIWLPPVELEHLSVQHDARCRVLEPDGQRSEEKVSVISCVGGDRLLRSYFLHTAATLIVSLGSIPSKLDVSRAIDKLAELFRAMREPARKSIQGLWAELFLISRARDLYTVVSAWHANPEDLYDFSAGNQKIEVKSALGRVRQHHFRLEQLHPPDGAKLLIVSVLVERTGSGVSVIELAEKARAQISERPDLVMHIDRLVGLTLGESWRFGLEDRFGIEMAETSLAFFEPSAIPSVCVDLPAGVSEVRFRSDLTTAPNADLTAYRKMGGLFEETLRR